MSQVFDLINNKKIIRKYIIQNSYEAGIVLNSELLQKTLNYKISLNACYGFIKNNELFLKNYSELDVKLLLHKYEINRIIKLIGEKKYQLLPSRVYLKNHKVKIEIVLAKYNKDIKNQEKLNKLREKSWKEFKLKGEYY